MQQKNKRKDRARVAKTEKPESNEEEAIIQEGTSLKKVTMARPLRYKSEAERTLQELMAKGVIIPTNETTD